jgi:hypothetical protein
LLEDASYYLTTSKQRKILTKLFHSTSLFNLSSQYFPFISRSSPPSLGELLRWKIRKDLLINDKIIFAIDVPLHILQILKKRASSLKKDQGVSKFIESHELQFGMKL